MSLDVKQRKIMENYQIYIQFAPLNLIFKPEFQT